VKIDVSELLAKVGKTEKKVNKKIKQGAATIETKSE
jgi:hypothetical protein